MKRLAHATIGLSARAKWHRNFLKRDSLLQGLNLSLPAPMGRSPPAPYLAGKEIRRGCPRSRSGNSYNASRSRHDGAIHFSGDIRQAELQLWPSANVRLRTAS